MSSNCAGGAAYAEAVYGGPTQQHAGPSGSIAMNNLSQNGGNTVPLVPGPSSMNISGSGLNKKSKKGRGIAVPIALLVANQWYGGRKSRRAEKAAGRRSGRRKSRGSRRSRKMSRSRR